MCESLSRGENVKISGFGTFVLRDKGERVGRNPKTGVEVPIAPRRVLTFRGQPDDARAHRRRWLIVTDTPSSKAQRRVSYDRRSVPRDGHPQHILRYWETRFPQLRPVTRAGNRRYYRPDDVVLVRRINGLLNEQGLPSGAHSRRLPIMCPPLAPLSLGTIRDRLARALAED